MNGSNFPRYFWLKLIGLWFGLLMIEWQIVVPALLPSIMAQIQRMYF